MTAYIISVLVAATSLSVAELIIPKGRLKSTVEIAISLIFISVMLMPVVDFDFSSVDLKYDTDYTDEAVTTYVENSLEKYYEKSYFKALKDAELIADKINVEFCGTKLNKIEIYLSNLVIEENNEHINITVIENYIAEKLNIQVELLTVYV